MRPGDRFLDRFAIERLAGEGGMGTVWRALDLHGGGPVALKLLHRQSAEHARRFAREAEVLRDLASPGIVRHVGHGVSDDGLLWLAMEWLEGEDLEARLARGSLDVPEALELVQRVAATVGLAHARGIVHRDLKPRNLFLPDGALARVKVLDFGIARLVGSAETATGLVLGTPWYMSPEQARADRRLDARSDVWALGCLLFECLTARTPFEGEQIMAILAKILLEEPPRLSSLRTAVPPALDALVARTLAKDPAERPADGAALAAEIAGVLARGDDTEAARGGVAASLGGGERRLVSVVLLGAPRPVALARTLTAGDELEADLALSAAAEPYGGKLERLADGSAVVALTGTGAATDQASRAARCALAASAVRTDAPVALATGLAEVSARFPVGEAIDRAAALVLGAGPGVWLDEVTRGLLGPRFQVRAEPADRFRLEAELDAEQGERVLLGHRAPLVGRARELATLEELFDECADEPVARAVLVTASAGVGKTRLRQELVARLSAKRPVGVWVGRGDPMSAGSPFALLADAVRSAVGLREGEPPAVARRRLRGRVAASVPPEHQARVVAFLGELIDVPSASDDEPGLRAAREDAILMGDQMRRAWEDFAAAECAKAPVLLVLEDLHWGDLPTVTFVDAALRNLADRPLMVLALARPEVQDLFPRLWEERRLQTLRLEQLTRRAATSLVGALLGDTAAPARVAELVERGAGNPFFLEELARAERITPGAAAPATVLAMLHARLESLPADTRRVLRAASVFGQIAWRGGVDALLGGQLGAAVVDEALSSLTDAELLVPRGETRFSGEESWGFRHALVRDAAYESLTPADRVTGHRLAADWLERAGERDALVLAEHLERGGEGARAIEWYRRAAEDALGGNDFALAVRCAARGAACGAAGEALGRLRLIEGQAHWWSGQTAAAEETSRAAVELLGPGGERCTALGDAAVAAGSLGHGDGVVALAEQLLAAGDVGAPARDAFCAAAARMAALLVNAGKVELADVLMGRLDALGETGYVPSPAALARQHFARALRRKTAGDLSGYLDSCLGAATAGERAGEIRYQVVQQINAGFAFLELGCNDEAETVLSVTLAAAVRLGVPLSVAGAQSNLSIACARLGRLAEARELQSRAVAALERLGNRRGEGGARCYLSEILLVEGDHRGALTEAERALTLLAQMPPLRPHALVCFARACLAQERADEARLAAQTARELVDALGDAAWAEARVRLTEVEALLGCGAHDEAVEHLRRAVQRLRMRAERIADPSRRRPFLDRVPENARTLALAAELVPAT